MCILFSVLVHDHDLNLKFSTVEHVYVNINSKRSQLEFLKYSVIEQMLV
jgi:hypothetical protein